MNFADYSKNTIMTCDCGLRYYNSDVNEHIKSKIHVQWKIDNDIINDTNQCNCGCIYHVGVKDLHLMSDKHLDFKKDWEL